MDFFAQQEAARRKSRWLTVTALLSAIPIVAMTSLVLDFVVWLAVIAFAHFDGPTPGLGAFIAGNVAWSNVWVPCVATAIVLVSGFLAYRRLADGVAVMERLGAKKARGDEERVLMNVVEEMALAAGCGVPSVWKLDGADDVNAFVAGYGDGDAALCVTDGALKHLSRDELQGVVAHEFGHVLNGDMRLNTHLAAVVEGMNGISDLGKTAANLVGERLRSLLDGDLTFAFSGRSRLSVVDLILYAAGIALQVIGGAGRLCGRALQGAVSREREFLADAAAVQFTRNPEGLADALRFSQLAETRGWRTRTTSAANVSHMFFVEEAWTVTRTHPPIEERIRRLSPSGLKVRNESLARRIESFRQARAEKAAENLARYETYARPKTDAKRDEQAFPIALLSRLRDPDEAGRLLCELLRTGALADFPLPTAAGKRRFVAKAVLAIRQAATPAAAATWAERIDALAKNGETHGSFEFMVSCAVNRQLRGHAPLPVVSPREVAPTVARVVATIAAIGRNPDRAYALASPILSPIFHPWPSRPSAIDGTEGFLSALNRLQRLAPLLKRDLLLALSAVIKEDGEITDDEGNYLAAVADAIGAAGWQTP